VQMLQDHVTIVHHT